MVREVKQIVLIDLKQFRRSLKMCLVKYKNVVTGLFNEVGEEVTDSTK